MKAHFGVRSGVATLASFLLLSLAALPAAAQQTGQVQGTVVNASSGEPLVGAQVLVEGTGIGTITNARGAYLLLVVPAGTQTIQVTHLGFGTESVETTVSAGQTATVNFELATEAIALDAVIATGTVGNVRRREIGTTVSLITAEQLEVEPILNVSDVLQGKAAGLTIRDVGGMAGSGSSIVLRGVNTLGGVRPLIYVDGTRLEQGSHANDPEINTEISMYDDLDAGSIERVEIVKGAAATTLYGTEAAGGVIQIFTKSGGGGAPSWTLSVDQGFTKVGHVGPEEDETGLHVNDCSDEPGCPESGSWLRTGHIQEYNLSVRGGTEVQYYVSGSFGSQQGNIAPQGASNMSFRGNFTFEPMRNLSIRTSNMYTRRDITWIPDGNNAEGLLLNVMRGPRDYTPGHDDSAVLEMKLNTLIDHFLTSANITWTPTANLMQRVNVGLDYVQSEYTEERPWGFFREPDGDRENDLDLDSNLTIDYAGTFSMDLPVADLVSTTSWGAQYYDQFSWGLNAFGDRFAGPGPKLVGSAVETDASESWTRIASGGFFLQEQLGWQDRLFVIVGARWDGFSTFGRDFGMAFYPKLSAAYTISDHAFWPAWWERNKIRVAVGESGRAPGPFAAERTWNSVSGDTRNPGVILGELGNPKVGPERTRELEFGMEGSVMDGRFSYDFTVYDQSTTDALLRLDRPTSVGTEQAILTNLGEVTNKGFEITANATVIRTPEISWDIGGNFANQENKIVSLGPVTDERLKDRPVDATFGDIVQNRDELGARPVFAEEYLGPRVPTTTWGANTSVTLMRRLTLSALGEYQGGHVRQASIARQNVRRQQWVPCQYVFDALDAGDVSNITAGERGRCDYNRSTYGEWTTAGDFFRLRSVSLSYRVPDQFLVGGASGMTLRLQARNLYTWVKEFPGVDPEVSEDGGAFATREYYNVPSPAVVMLNLTVNF